ncbi:MAG: hypothetical protein VYD05_03175, partial [Planctomycetota bacterium]|nr:hypothetical protein [Planctomycetota bacterium]
QPLENRVKAALLCLSLPIAAALAFAPAPARPGQDPQDPAPENIKILSISDLQYVDQQGNKKTVPAANVVEIRLFDDHADSVRLELLYDNGDYSLIDAQAMHILRKNGSTRDVRLVRTQRATMRFPRLP